MYFSVNTSYKKVMKKVLLTALCVTLVLGAVPAKASAKQSTGEEAVPAVTMSMPTPAQEAVKSEEEITQENMERILRKVKSTINIPEEYSEFEYDFMDSYRYNFINTLWVFRWSTTDGNCSIEVGADEAGNIVGYSKYVYPTVEASPKFLKSELENKVDKFVYSLSEEFKGKLTKLDTVGPNRNRYLYKYERTEHGIPMPANSIVVEVDNRTGEIYNCEVSWLFGADIEKPEIKLSEQQAKAKIDTQLEMKLCYRDNVIYNDDGTYEIKTFLVYYPETGYLAVDAKTGEIYDTRSEWNEISNETGAPEAEAKAMDSSAAVENGAGLTEKELEKIAELADLITKEAAIKSVRENKSLLMDKSMISVNASLSTYGNYYEKEKRYVWNIRFSDPTPADYENNDYYRAYANATVDAKTGELISYRASLKDFYSMTPEEIDKVKTKYSVKKCRKIFEEFALAQNKEMFENTVFDSNNKEVVIAVKEDKSRVYGGNSFRYVRTNEGIRYDSNYITGAVDAVSGKIYNYRYNWYNNVKFDSPKKAISEKEAFDAYMSYDGFDLVYEIVTVNNYVDTKKIAAEDFYYGDDQYYIDYKTRLVYRTEISPAYVSAFTGKQLDYDGEEYDSGKKTGYTYSDISGNKYERSILILADLGIGFEDGKFNPDKVITREELQEMLTALRYYRSTEDILKGNKKLTRKVAAKAVATFLNLNTFAELKGIFKTGYADNDKIPEKYIGYIALVNGLNLIDADKNNNFNPDKGLTRAEAAELLIRLQGKMNMR